MLPVQTSKAFGAQRTLNGQAIEKIYVINLDREPTRWSRIKQELGRIRDAFGNDLLTLTERHAAVDARCFSQDPAKDAEVDPITRWQINFLSSLNRRHYRRGTSLKHRSK